MDSQYQVFDKHQQGSNHVKAEKPCEDYSGSYHDEHMSICVVADGHGSDNYPRTEKGSKFAVAAALDCMRAFLEQVSPEDILGHRQAEILTQLERSILNNWYTRVEADANAEELTAEELAKVSDKYKRRYQQSEYLPKAYGTTLIIFAVTETFSLGVQIGDGSCVMMDTNGSLSLPIPSDPNCQLNITTSICDEDAGDEFRYYVSAQAPAAVFCGTDGVEDSYSTTRELCDLYRSIVLMFAEHGFETGEAEIADYLPILTRRGSGDDVSIAGILQMQAVVELQDKLQCQAKLAKAARELDNKKNSLRILKEAYNTCLQQPTHTFFPKLFQKFPGPALEELNAQRLKIEQYRNDIDRLEKEKAALEKEQEAYDVIDMPKRPEMEISEPEEKESISAEETSAEQTQIPESAGDPEDKTQETAARETDLSEKQVEPAEKAAVGLDMTAEQGENAADQPAEEDLSMEQKAEKTAEEQSE